MQRLSITIDDEIKHKLDAITPKGGRAAFISRAIEKAIEEWHKQQALEKILAFKPYKIDLDSVEVLREVRQARTQDVIDASRG